MNKHIIAQRMNQFDSTHLSRAFARAAAMTNPIDLSIGFPEDDTPGIIKKAGIKAIQNNKTRYTPPNGTLALRSALAAKLELMNGIAATPETVSVTPGATTGILLAYLALLNPGDEILLPDPYFPPYRDIATMLGAVPVLIDTFPDFQLTARRIEPLITENTRVLVINTPNNPSGAVYPEIELRRIARLARKHNITIIADEIYEHFAYDIPHFSIGSIYHQTLTLNGFSKAYAMTGWRLGYMAGPLAIIAAINQLQQYIVFSSSSIAQEAGVAALRFDPSKLTDKYRRKRDLVREYLADSYHLAGSQGAFYAFIPVPTGHNDISFARAAVEKNVIILPSRAFSMHTDYVRIAFATDRSKLERGLKIMRELATDSLVATPIINGAVAESPN